MPRTYIRKKIKSYTPQDLAQAIEKVKNGELTLYRAAKEFKIPTTTLYEHIKESKENTRPNAGRPTAIPIEEEKKLAETIIIMEKWGFGLSRYEILEIVAEYVRINNIQTPFKNNIPGPDWFINFRKRHRLSIKKAQPLEYVRRKMTDPFIIAEYFNLLETTLTNLDLLDKPHFIWNLDETSLCLDPSRTKIVGQINKPCSRTTYGSGKENITVLTGVSADGKKLPPLIVFKGKFVWDQWMADQNDVDYDFELSYAASAKGWMETDIFYNYFDKVLIPNIGEERPVLIIYDGHSTHVDVRVIELAIRNRITILKLPPHTSHLLQPLDIAVFRSFKTMWDSKLVEWQRRNIGIKMPKKVFAKSLADTWQQTNTDIIKRGFKKSGIYPFNSDVVPVDKYDPDVYKRYQKKKSEANIAHTHPNADNPKSLKEICTVLFNNQLRLSNNDSTISANDNVTLLSQVSKSDTQVLRFVAKYPTELPICLQDPKPILKQTQNLSKINIISDIIIQKPQQPLPQLSCTFEELLLKKIQQDKKEIVSTKKSRVTRGAEVITATMGKKILEEIENNKDMKATTKRKKNYKKDLPKTNKRNNSTMKICTLQNQEEQPSSSGIKYKNKRKRLRQLSLDTITSVSDIISIHNDPDIIDYTDLEETTEEHYKISDTVLVRYLIRKKWKYYIGFIEEIIKHESTYYFINFLKTARLKQQLTFIITKRKDSDKVPESLIVKKIDIQKKYKNEKEYYLCNDGDRIYFD